MLDDKEIEIGRKAIDFALGIGASDVRITLSKSVTDVFGMLDGRLDKVTHSLDLSLSLALFVDGRYGTFSTNRVDPGSLPAFVREAVDMVRMLEKDPFRALPERERTASDAVSGNELGLCDGAYFRRTSRDRKALAAASTFHASRKRLEKGFRILSEEGEYSESLFDSVVMDSRGLFARHSETSFEIGYEVTVEDPSGERISGYWWDSSPTLEGIAPSVESCSRKALRRAAEQIGPGKFSGGRMNMVVDSECASTFLRPVLSALGGYSIQQKNSFLEGKIGERVFSESLNVVDEPRTPGATGSRLFDSEGVATRPRPIIENGVVKTYFINTYIAAKTGLEPTVEDAVRVRLCPFGDCRTREDLLEKAGSGILVTGINGGNSNSATGDFSYGIEGFLFRDGKVVHPVREMLVTGNFMDLWSHLAATADDARPCMTKRIPSLAFSDVDLRG